MDRTFKAYSPLGDQLRFRSLAGREQISRLFEFRVNLLSESDAIGAKSLLGQDLSVEVDLTTEKNGGGKRFLSGQVVQFSFAGRDGDYFAYEAVLRPWLWLATRRSDFKIFQFKDVPTIVQEVLAPYGFTVINKLTGNYRAWDYCVQYGETDFNFISRLLETEGAYFFFEHAQGSHKLVLADGIGSHTPLPQGPSNIGAAYNLNVGAMMATVVGVNQIAKIGSEKTTTVGKKYELTVGGGGGGGGGAPAGGGLTMNIQAPSAGDRTRKGHRSAIALGACLRRHLLLANAPDGRSGARNPGTV